MNTLQSSGDYLQWIQCLLRNSNVLLVESQPSPFKSHCNATQFQPHAPDHTSQSNNIVYKTTSVCQTFQLSEIKHKIGLICGVFPSKGMRTSDYRHRQLNVCMLFVLCETETIKGFIAYWVNEPTYFSKGSQ